MNGDHIINYMTPKGEAYRKASDLTPMKAIRLKCLDCSNGYSAEVARCRIETCPLWPYRFGKRPQFDEWRTA